MGRLERLEQRRLDSSVLIKAASVNEVYKQLNQSEPVKYTIGAMQPIDPDYTKNTFVQGDRVRNQLKERLTQVCDFEYQGSTTTDTHIKARSDIDLLVIHNQWTWLEPPQVPTNPYRGDPKVDICNLRIEAGSALISAFPQAEHDQQGSRAIRVSGGSLTRDVDVVPASWYDTNEYVRTHDLTYRGVRIFDVKKGVFKLNTPFLHKRRIEERDQETHGGLRKAIRLLKTLMYDSDGRVDMSSYNICGIAYNIATANLTVQRPRELAILEACHEYCQRLMLDTTERDRIVVPDEHRSVFGGDDGATLDQLRAIAKEISNLRFEILLTNSSSFQRLDDANIQYR